MGIQYPLKYTKVGGLNTGFQEFEPGDQITANLMSGLMGRNRIINGRFDIWQRGTSFTAQGFGADRFFNNPQTGQATTCTMSRIALGVLDLPAEAGRPQYACRMAVVGATTGFATLQHRLENLRQFVGRTVTFSCWVRSLDAGKKVVFESTASFGTGGSAGTNSIGIKSFNIAAANVFTKITNTFTVPDYSGSTFGPDETSALNFNMWLSDTANPSRNENLGQQSGTYDFACMQLEIGEVETEFEYRHPALELMLCQRYFWRQIWGSTAARAMFAKYSATSAITWVTHPVPMRITPAVSMNFVMVATPGGASSGVAPSPQDKYQTSILGVIAGSAAVGTSGYFNAPSGADGIIDYDAEL